MFVTSIAFPEVNAFASIEMILPLFTLFEFTRTIPLSDAVANDSKFNNDPVVSPLPLFDTSIALPEVNASASIEMILPLFTLFEFTRTTPFSGDDVFVDTCNNDPLVSVSFSIL